MGSESGQLERELKAYNVKQKASLSYIQIQIKSFKNTIPQYNSTHTFFLLIRYQAFQANRMMTLEDVWHQVKTELLVTEGTLQAGHYGFDLGH